MESVKVVQRLRVSPPPGSVPAADLTLTYFDIVWQGSPPNRRLLFYRYNNNTEDFRNSHFSRLQRSLSLALTLFYPVAGRLVPLTENGSENHVIRYSDGDSVPLTLAESQTDFDHLVSNHLKDVKDLHPFAPALQPFSEDEQETTQKTPLLAIQVTVFPFSGVCIGITLHHVVADGSSSTNFLRTWASICKAGGCDVAIAKNLPLYDRALVGDLEELKRNLIADMKKIQHGPNSDPLSRKQPRVSRVLSGTFVLTRAHIEKLRHRLKSSGKDVGPRPSTYTITTAYVWVCTTKAARGIAEGESIHFAFAVDCRSRLNPPVPATYFGNCVGPAFVAGSGSELTGENGFCVAAEAIHRAIRGLDEGGILKDANDWLKNWLRIANKRVLSVASSPRFKVYEADFGWGQPHKVEVVSIENNGAISLAESRYEEGGVEIGFVGPDYEMERFASIFHEGLQDHVTSYHIN